MQYRTKPIYVDAVQFTGTNQNECLEFCGGSLGQSRFNYSENALVITFKFTTDRVNVRSGMWVFPTEWIIHTVDDDFIVTPDKLFRDRYEPVSDVYIPPESLQAVKEMIKQMCGAKKVTPAEWEAWHEELVKRWREAMAKANGNT